MPNLPLAERRLTLLPEARGSFQELTKVVVPGDLLHLLSSLSLVEPQGGQVDAVEFDGAAGRLRFQPSTIVNFEELQLGTARTKLKHSSVGQGRCRPNQQFVVLKHPVPTMRGELPGAILKSQLRMQARHAGVGDYHVAAVEPADTNQRLLLEVPRLKSMPLSGVQKSERDGRRKG